MAEIADAVKPDEQALATINVIGKGINPNATAPDRLELAKVVNQKATTDQEGHFNTQTQWLPLLGAVATGNVREAIKYFNGGPTREELATHPVLGEFVRQYNQRGPTGVIFDKQGRQLSPAEIKKLDEAGGLIGNTDRNAIETGMFKAATENQKNFVTGLARPVAEQYAKSVETAAQGSAIRDAIQDRIKLVAQKDMAPVLEYYSKLKPEDRVKLFKIVSQQTGASTGANVGTTAGNNANVLQGQNVQNTVGLKGGLGNPEGGVAGAVVPGGLGISAGRSTGGMNQANVGANTGASRENTASNSLSVQSNLMSELNSLTQGVIKTPEQFTGLQKLFQLNEVLGRAQEEYNKDPQALAPGAERLPDINPLMNSRIDSVVHDIKFQRNNSLNVAWNAFLAKEMHSNIRNVEPSEIGQLREKFKTTNTFKAINNTYADETSRAKGEKVEPAEGALYINKNNRLQRWVDGQWEPVNANK
jgi:hypothetical protein